jgi:glucokinase
VANIFDPEVIVLGGGVIVAGEPFLGPARDELARMTAAQRRRPLRLVVTSLGGDNGIIGAAALAREAARGVGAGGRSEEG